MQVNLQQMVESLQKIRQEHGAADFQHALQGLFRDLIQKDGGLSYIERLLKELGSVAEGVDLGALESEAKKAAGRSSGDPEPVRVLEAAIKQAVPNCKTQAHFDLILQAWQVLQLYINAAYGFDRETAAKAREGLDRLLDLAPQLAAAHEKLEGSPEATTNRDFVDPPKQFTEVETHRRLMSELRPISNMQDLARWWSQNRALMDGRIVTQKLRDELFDTIRAKKTEFGD